MLQSAGPAGSKHTIDVTLPLPLLCSSPNPPFSFFLILIHHDSALEYLLNRLDPHSWVVLSLAIEESLALVALFIDTIILLRDPGAPT
jgi:hypothetical protein